MEPQVEAAMTDRQRLLQLLTKQRDELVLSEQDPSLSEAEREKLAAEGDAQILKFLESVTVHPPPQTEHHIQ